MAEVPVATHFLFEAGDDAKFYKQQEKACWGPEKVDKTCGKEVEVSYEV